MGTNVKAGVIWRRIGGKTFIIDTDREKMHSLNETAAFFWELLAAGKETGEIARKAAERFETGGEEIANDLEEFLELLKKEKLLL